MRLQMIENETRRREKKTNKTTKKKLSMLVVSL